MSNDGLIVAGWIVVQLTPTPAHMGSTLPPTMLTISDCIQADMPQPDNWLGDWFQDHQQASDAVKPLLESDAHLVTVAMHPNDASVFMDARGGSESPWFELLRRREPLSATLQILGYEVVGAEEYLDFHSWHCHGYADDALTALGIGVNDLGLIPSLEGARRVCAWMLALPSEEAPIEVPWTVVGLAAPRDT